ncbi:Por secretion system C-terminal sorting domain-containing protein [Dyadobacter koreensis]|uniref:Por secretion system C-terminal sorting domain-containing protein n=1 Tax=Dyadobacter koreensis TaxID=408657 RepID=A0A1H6R099_9BACT|nr:T9SS type A sorting domain-containing protein [Dyadobacter koreensis]SEI45867.1 Por secretion system C-terminal sorting domain-containing protein [Dyadobacter koreensis]
MKKFYCSLLIAALFLIRIPNVHAALSQGDLAVIGMNSDLDASSSSKRSFAVVALSNIAKDEEIYFTDRGWVNAFGSTPGHFVGALDSPPLVGTYGNEGRFQWKPSAIIPAGTVIIFKIDLAARAVSGVKGDGTALPLTDLSILSDRWTNTNLSANPWPATIGDQILIYQGTESNPSFIFAFNNLRSNATNVSNGWFSNPTGTEPTTQFPAYSELPAGLNTNCSLGFLNSINSNDRPNAIYVPVLTSGTKKEWLDDITKPANWKNKTPNDTPYDFTQGFGSGEITFFDMGALPVTLVRYSARLEGATVKVEWSTAAETDNDHFEIEHSTDAKNFKMIGFIEATGSSSVRRDYTWYDNRPLNGTNYYRLVQIDYDGKTTKYGIKSLSFGLETEGRAILYPNPAVETVTIPLSGKTSRVELLDANGKLLRRLAIGENEVNIIVPVNNLSPGAYFIHLFTEAGIRSSKFVKF